MVGCEPDRWQVYDVKWQKVLDKQARESRAVEVPQEDQPRMERPTTLPNLQGDGPLSVSVEQATLIALRNNRDLAVQELNPVIVGTFEQIERGAFDPEAFAGFEYQRESATEVANSTGGEFSVKSDEYEAIGGVRQRLPTGTDVELNVSQGRTDSSRSPELQDARVGLSVTQALLRGFGPAVNLAGIRQAEFDTKASRYELRGYVESLLADTEVAYWRYCLAHEEIAIFKESLELATRQSDEIQQQIEVGALPQTEGAAAKAEVALREQALINARSEMEAARLRLLRLMNAGPGGRLDRILTATSNPRIEPEPITDITQRVELAQKMRPDLNQARMLLERNRLETIVTKNGLLPRLDLFIVLGKTGYSNTFFDSFEAIGDNDYDFAGGFTFTQFLNNRAAEARDLAARATRRQSADAVSNLSQLVDLDVRLAINEVERARQQIDASRVTRIFQEETAQAEVERFEVGASTSLLVAQAQRDLLQAQITEVEAVVNYRIALVQLYLAEGSLLERRGVVLQ